MHAISLPPPMRVLTLIFFHRLQDECGCLQAKITSLEKTFLEQQQKFTAAERRLEEEKTALNASAIQKAEALQAIELKIASMDTREQEIANALKLAQKRLADSTEAFAASCKEKDALLASTEERATTDGRALASALAR